MKEQLEELREELISAPALGSDLEAKGYNDCRLEVIARLSEILDL
jgi:hypothetical protein